MSDIVGSTEIGLAPMDIGYLLRRAAMEFPGSPAVDDGRRALQLGELIGRGERLANAFESLGLRAGTRVGILSGNRTEYVEVDVALALGRYVRVALNARLHIDDFRYIAADSGMGALIHSSEFAQEAAVLRRELGLVTVSLDAGDEASAHYDKLLSEAPAQARRRSTDPEGPAWITYTSGTTGRPKGIVLSHRSIREVAFNLLLELGPVMPGEQLVLTQALSHGAGYFVLPYLLRGAGLFVQRRFDAEEVCALSQRENIRTLKAVPAMLPALLDAADGNWGFDSLLYGASPVPLPVLEESLDRFGPSLVQIYGQSEAPVTLTCLHKEDHLLEDARLSAGRPWRTVAVEVWNDDGRAPPGELGEVYVQGPHMMTRYHENEEATSEVFVDGWIRTKDMARTDDRGFIYLQGRSDEMINSGGYNVSPREVEDALVAHASVEEAVVLGVRDEQWGQAVTAVVRIRPGAELTEDELISFSRPRLGIRTPKRVLLWDSIPRTPYGKVDRSALRVRVEEAVR